MRRRFDRVQLVLTFIAAVTFVVCCTIAASVTLHNWWWHR